MKTGEIITIRPALKEDYEAIKKGLEEWFWPYEPLLAGYQVKTPPIQENEKYLSMPEKKGMTLVATIPDEGEKIVGFSINGPIYPDLDDNTEDMVDKRYNAYFRFLHDFQKKVDIFKLYNVDKSFHIEVIAIDPELRGNNIGYKLFERSLKMAKEMGYKIASVACSSKYSANIARRLNMDEVASTEYKEYKNSEGNPIFTPPPEHTHLIKFVKKL